MFRRTPVLSLFAAGSAMLLVGCMPKMTLEEMKAMMPQRPAELDRLNDFVGTWDMTGEATMAGLDEVLKTTGVGETKWAGNGWFLVSNAKFEMEGLNTMEAVETWSYDAHSKKYRSTWTDSMGSLGTGSSRYNEKTRTWTMRATSHGAHGKTTAKGTLKMVDKDTMEWTWSEYAMGGLFKVMEMKGTSKRR